MTKVGKNLNLDHQSNGKHEKARRVSLSPDLHLEKVILGGK